MTLIMSIGLDMFVFVSPNTILLCLLRCQCFLVTSCLNSDFRALCGSICFLVNFFLIHAFFTSTNNAFKIYNKKNNALTLN